MTDMIVDFNDPESIARAIPRAKERILQAEQRVVAAKEEVDQAFADASDAEIEVQRLKAVLLTLQQLDAETMPAPPDGAEQGSSKDQALRVIIAINSPTNVAEVAEHLTDFSRKTVSWALWKLADEGVIQRLGHGRYAPPGYVPGRPVTTNYLNLPHRFPAPSKAEIDHIAEEALAKAQAHADD